MLDTVNLNYVVTREGGWDTAADWKVRIHHISPFFLRGKALF